MNRRFIKYLFAYSLPLVVAFAFSRDDIWSFSALFYAFGIVPLLELFLKPDPGNLESWEREMMATDRIYDWLLYLVVPVQIAFLIWFLNLSSTADFSSLAFWGHCSAMGMMCGVLGINVAHELGHRQSRFEQLLAKILLFTSMYPHFFIEHNYGHHKNVATAEDPASARYGESLYAFWWRSIIYSYRSAWQIELKRLERKKQFKWGLSNEMLVFSLLEVALLLGIYLLFGGVALLAFLISAVTGILLLETVNYIEHYGLSRNRVNEKRYERATALHSWNSNHVVGRLLLFELSRHSDHHAQPHKKYQLLDYHEDSPQMPTGYPGMMLLSALPPLWFRVMHWRIKKS